jgi:hypothetical protein
VFLIHSSPSSPTNGSNELISVLPKDQNFNEKVFSLVVTSEQAKHMGLEA